MTDVSVRLAADRARLDAATPGRWEVDLNIPFSSEIVGVFAESQKRYVVQQEVNGYDGEEEFEDGLTTADAKFIAWSRTGVGEYLDALQAVLDALEFKYPHVPLSSWTDDQQAAAIIAASAARLAMKQDIHAAISAALGCE